MCFPVRNSAVPEKILREEARRFEGEAYKSATDEDHYLTTLCYVTRNPVSKKRISASFEAWKASQFQFSFAQSVESPVGLPLSGRNKSLESSRPSGYVSETQSESSADDGRFETSKSAGLPKHTTENPGPNPVRLNSLPPNLGLTAVDHLVDSFVHTNSISLDGSSPDGNGVYEPGRTLPMSQSECPDAIMAEVISPACRNQGIAPAVSEEPTPLAALKSHREMYMSKLEQIEALLDRCAKPDADMQDFIAVLNVKQAAMSSLRQSLEALENVEKSVVDQISAKIAAHAAQTGFE